MSEIWEAKGKYVYRGKDCIGIFDTDNATDAIMEERARIAASAPDLLEALRQISQAFSITADNFEEVEVDGEMVDPSDLEYLARAAISKATPA